MAINSKLKLLPHGAQVGSRHRAQPKERRHGHRECGAHYLRYGSGLRSTSAKSVST